MALSWPLLLQLHSQSSLASSTNFVFFSDLTESRALDAPCAASLNILRRKTVSVPALKPKVLTPSVKCVAGSTEEKSWSDAEIVVSDSEEAGSEDNGNDQLRSRTSTPEADRVECPKAPTSYSGDSISIGIREPVSYFICFTYNHI